MYKMDSRDWNLANCAVCLSRLVGIADPSSYGDQSPQASRPRQCSSPRSIGLLRPEDIDIEGFSTPTPDPEADHQRNYTAHPDCSETYRCSPPKDCFTTGNIISIAAPLHQSVQEETTTHTLQSVNDLETDALPDFTQLTVTAAELSSDVEHIELETQNLDRMTEQDISNMESSMDLTEENDSESVSDYDTDSDYSCSECSSTPDISATSEPEHLLNSTLEDFNRRLLRRLMLEVYSLLYHNAGYRSRPESRDAESSSRRASSGSNQSNSNRRSHNNRNQGEGGGRNPPDDDADNGGGSRNPRTNSPPDSNEEPVRFACPYYKRNPAAHYKYQSCAGPGFQTIHRLK
jgi:hypothetical protein